MLHVQQQFIVPDVNFFVHKIRKAQPFNFCKLNHGFWECCYAISNNPNMQPRQTSGHLAEGWLQLHGKEFLDEILQQISFLPKTRIMLGVSNKGTPTDFFEKGEKYYDFILSHFPPNYKLYFGPLMKHYVINKTIGRLMESLKCNLNILFVGLPHIQKIVNFYDFKNVEFVILDTNATKKRNVILNQILEAKKDIVLFQAGESLSFWFSYKLCQEQPEVTTIDFGRALDYWCVSDHDYPYFPDIKNQMWKSLVK